MTTKKIVIEVVHETTGGNKTSTREEKFTHNPEDVPLEDWLTAIDQAAARQIATIYDNQTAVLVDDNGAYYAVRSYGIITAKAWVVDTLDV
jgi:hypothetical protein